MGIATVDGDYFTIHYLPIGGEPHGDCDYNFFKSRLFSSPNRRRAPWGLRRLRGSKAPSRISPNRRRAPWGLRPYWRLRRNEISSQ